MLNFDIVCDFVGPTVKMHSPNVNFGLNNINDIKTVKFFVENLSDIPATILFKEHSDEAFNFDTHTDIS